MIEVRNVSFSYEGIGKNDKTVEILRNINFQIENDQFFCILGPSGGGKSTLLKLFAGFERCTKGEMLDNGAPISGISHERAMVFQEDAVFPWINVHDNVEYGLKVRGIPKSEREERVAHFIKLVELEGSEKRFPKELSGGMKKRVDLARVLANDSRIILMDEPFGALDAMTKERMQEQLARIWEVSRKTIIFITHDIEEALYLGNHIAILQPIANGGEIKIVDVDFPRPRSLGIKEDPRFQKMRRELIEELKKYEPF